MEIKNTLAALLTTLIIVSTLACGSDGGTGASANGQNPLESNNFSSATNSENPLIGTWVSGGYTLTFKSGNTYSCDLNRGGIPVGSGSVMISGNVVIFTDAVGSNSFSLKDDGQIISGSYTYAIYGDTLTFSPILDLCRDRINILCLSYQKKGYKSDIRYY